MSPTGLLSVALLLVSLFSGRRAGGGGVREHLPNLDKKQEPRPAGSVQEGENQTGNRATPETETYTP